MQDTATRPSPLGVRHNVEPTTQRGSVVRAGSCHQRIPASHDRLRSSIALPGPALLRFSCKEVPVNGLDVLRAGNAHYQSGRCDTDLKCVTITIILDRKVAPDRWKAGA